MNTDLALRLALALAIGLVIGLERGWRQRDEAAGSRTAGIRTYSLIGLLGGVFGALGSATGAPVLIGVGFIGFSAVFAWFSRAEAVRDRDYSVTGTVAAMLVYALGACAVVGDMQLAAMVAIAAAALLASRERLHALLERITWPELRSALLLLGMTAIVLPFLPNHAVDPLGAVNPREICLFTIMVAGLSYVGYLAMRVLGPSTGVIVTGLTGGLVSSTAVTFAFARRAATGDDARILFAGAASAGAVSLLRVLVVVALLKPAVALAIAAPVLAAAVVLLAPAVLTLTRSAKGDAAAMQLGNPFDLLPVLFFALLLAGVSLAAAWVNSRFGAAGLYPVAALSGLIDVDAVSVSAARLAGKSIGIPMAAGTILVALASNAFARACYAGFVERGPLALRLAGTTVGAFCAGWLAMVVSHAELT